jgi:hypothetical protein
MRAIITDVQLKENHENIFLATVTISAPAMEEFVVECKYKPADVNIPLDVPFFTISDASKALIQSRGFTVRSIIQVLKSAVIKFAETA